MRRAPGILEGWKTVSDFSQMHRAELGESGKSEEIGEVGHKEPILAQKGGKTLDEERFFW